MITSTNLTLGCWFINITTDKNPKIKFTPEFVSDNELVVLDILVSNKCNSFGTAVFCKKEDQAVHKVRLFYPKEI